MCWFPLLLFQSWGKPGLLCRFQTCRFGAKRGLSYRAAPVVIQFTPSQGSTPHPPCLACRCPLPAPLLIRAQPAILAGGLFPEGKPPTRTAGFEAKRRDPSKGEGMPLEPCACVTSLMRGNVRPFHLHEHAHFKKMTGLGFARGMKKRPDGFGATHQCTHTVHRSQGGHPALGLGHSYCTPDAESWHAPSLQIAHPQPKPLLMDNPG